ncbi:hypothetical protein [Actinospongicola halichondriae]|uniref:hypothetical protein n=1 Tax=Actinospongicola halichondriae TaxID=3236844 RepID=UPI003D46F724
MTIMVLVVLAAIWAGVLLPPYLQKRRATHPSSSVVDFHQQLAVLQRTGRALDGAELHDAYADPRAAQPHAVQAAASYGYAPQRMSRNDVMRRRRDVFVTLVGAALLTFVLALALGGSVWLFHLLVDAALLGYVAMLLQIQQQRQMPVQRPAVRRPVQYAPQRTSATQQALLRRSAS